jgi:hypothetical protein
VYCDSTVKVIACIEDSVVTNKMLGHLDEKVLATETIRLPESRAIAGNYTANILCVGE